MCWSLMMTLRSTGLLGEYLTLEGIAYTKALSGDEGLKLAAQTKPDAIILDCMLPDIDGMEVAQAVIDASFDGGDTDYHAYVHVPGR